MNETPSLFFECPTRCGNLVDDPRWPCAECEAALAGFIRPASQPVSIEEATAALADRDRTVAAVYAARRTMTPLPDPADAAAAAGLDRDAAPPTPPRAAAAGEAGPEYKRNQRCWVCEERRSCRPDPDDPARWICRMCEAIT